MGVVVRFEVEDVGGGSGVASVVDQEVSDTAPNLQVSVDAVKELLEACKGIDPSLA